VYDLCVHSKLKETARAVGKIVQECKIPIDIEEYAQSFNPDMIEVRARHTPRTF
jgi:ATP-dependent RNA helicase DOB1